MTSSSLPKGAKRRKMRGARKLGIFQRQQAPPGVTADRSVDVNQLCELSLSGRFVQFVAARSLWGDADFRLADVGVSGGLASRWDVFGDRLWAVGFDPLIAEVRRLSAAETRPKVRYEAAYVGRPDLEEAFRASRADNIPIQLFERSSARKAHQLTHQDYVRDMYNTGEPIVRTDRRLSLDEFFEGQAAPDFIKVDTDGHDFPVLLGAERLLSNGVLGVEVEVQFHGNVHQYANTFDNIDRFLRSQGFSLFHLTPYRYS